MSKNLATTLALSAATMFLAAGCGKNSKGTEDPGAAAAKQDPADKIKCMGVNECKGQSACDVPNAHACAGQNECKGKGWIVITRSECDTKGGNEV